MVFAYFDLWTGSAGGAMIGLSAASLLLLNGDILGASGIASTTLLSPDKAINDKTFTWKVVFLASFAIMSNFYVLFIHEYDDKRMGEDASTPILSTVGFLLAGFLVGFGTKLGNGCTSGHGVCGLARFSVRSFAAVVAFMATAMATQALVSPDNSTMQPLTQFLRTDYYDADKFVNAVYGWRVSIIVFLASLLAFRNSRIDSDETTPLKNGSADVSNEKQNRKSTEAKDDNSQRLLGAVLAGGLFAVGLALSGMIYQSKVFGFLNLYLLFKTGTYDPTLIMVMGSACIVSMVAYQMVKGFHVVPSHPWIRSSPVMCSKFSVPRNQVIDMKLLAGAVCFGLGWGLGGICPGPGIFLAVIGAKPVLFFWWPTFLIGSWMAQKLKETL